MIKFKSIFLFAAVLFVANYVMAESNVIANSATKPLFVSFNGRYTNIVFSVKDKLWIEKNNLSFEKIQKECKNQPDNPDVWYAAGLYRRFKMNETS